jgi:hypothetical protein
MLKKVKKLQGKIFEVLNEAKLNTRNKVLKRHQLTFEVEENQAVIRLCRTEFLNGAFDEENLGKPVEFTLDDYGNVCRYKIKVKTV